jgi:putative endonuclease
MNASRRKSHQRGLYAETLAAWWLRLKGYRILATRYKTPVGEIDIVARRRRTLAFVEVKARSTVADAAASIHARNQQRVVRAAQHYLQSHPQYAADTIRFDAVLVTWYGWPHHLCHAWGASSSS